MKFYLFEKSLLGVLLSCLLLNTGWAASPNISLQGLDGKTHALSEYIGKGKWVIFNIWGTGCPPCLEEMPELQFFYDENAAKKAIVVGAAVDFPSFGYAKKDKVQKFVNDNLISFPILLTDGSISEKIGAGVLAGTPTTLIFNPAGKMVAYRIGPVTRKVLDEYIQRVEARKS